MITMNEHIDISVIIPVYNAGENIRKIIVKLLSEYRINIELIIINDGSTDTTKEVISQIKDPRIVYREQENKGVYAARNHALEIHKGRWVVLLDADDDIDDNFLYNRFILANHANVDVVISNASHCDIHGNTKKSVHSHQVYNKVISGSEWIISCVTNNEWPHYLWLQTINSQYIRKNNLFFQDGRSHKDIIWTMSLAAADGRFIVSDFKDYHYVSNPVSITHRDDYYNVRIFDYIDVIESLIACAYDKKNKKIKSALLKHALVESRHFLGLYRRKITNQKKVKSSFTKRIAFSDLLKGVTDISDVFFFIKILIKLK